MTGYALRLDPKQVSRVLEQSARAHAAVWAETTGRTELLSVTGRIIAVDAEHLTLSVDLHVDSAMAVPGRYFQLVIALGGDRYLAVCDLLNTETADDGTTMTFSRPATLQITQRRGTVRWMPGRAHPVYLSWDGSTETLKTPVLGQVCDLSTGGISVTLPETVDRHLFIGDTVYVRFSLDVHQAECFSEAVVCHKGLRPDKGELTVGLQFVDQADNDAFLSRLQTAMREDMQLRKGT